MIEPPSEWVLVVRGPSAREAHARWVFSQLDTTGPVATCVLRFGSRKDLVLWLRRNRQISRGAGVLLHPPEPQVLAQASETGVSASEVRTWMRDAVWTVAGLA